MKMVTCFPKKCNPYVAKCGYKRHHYWVAVGFAWFVCKYFALLPILRCM